MVTSLYQSFETSGLIIQRSGWTIRNPKIKDVDQNSAIQFIQNVPPRDKRKNFEESRFRLLCIKDKDSKQREAILKAANRSGWIGSEFEALLSKGSGSVLLDGSKNITLILQTPDDHMPLLSLSMKELGENGKIPKPDWVCLLFASEMDLKFLLDDLSVPQDFGVIPIDFMFLLVEILSIQAERIRNDITELMKALIHGEKDSLPGPSMNISRAKDRLFKHEERHLQLQTRSRFVIELADNITKCFDKIVNRHQNKAQTVQYSNTLRQRVEAQVILSRMMQPDLDAIPAKIQAQHRMIDAAFNATMARISFSSAEQTRRDSSSMKAIAVVTLVFLPATFIAAIFSMSMFDWLAGQSDTVVSNRLWIFFVFSVPLTCTVLVIWRVSYIQKEREFKKNREEFMERWQV